MVLVYHVCRLADNAQAQPQEFVFHVDQDSISMVILANLVLETVHNAILQDASLVQQVTH